MKRFWFFSLSLLFFLAACTPKASVAHNLSFNINRGGQILVTLVHPKGNGPSAGFICKHWMEPAPADRLHYLNEATMTSGQAEAGLLPQVSFLLWSSVSSILQNENPRLIGKDQDAQGVRISVDPGSPVSEVIETCWYRFQWDPQRHPGRAENLQDSLTYCGKFDPCKLDFTLGPHFQLPMA
jgi:hypothetical protein